MDFPTFFTVFKASGIGGVLEYLSIESVIRDQEAIFKNLRDETKKTLGQNDSEARSGSIFELTELADKLKRR